jgi:hypothetical protein
MKSGNRTLGPAIELTVIRVQVGAYGRIRNKVPVKSKQQSSQ